MAPGAIGREEELDALEALLTRVADRPAALVFSGEPGIGKTTLWEIGVAAAKKRFGRVLTCRGVQAEASLAYAGLSELIEPILEEAIPSLAPPRRRALEVALLLAEPDRLAPDAHAIGLAVLDVLRSLAHQAPLVVAIDDAQWLDPSSEGVLQIALRRLRDERVGLLATLRKLPEVAAPLALESVFPEDSLDRLWLAPLTLAALDRLLRHRLSLVLTKPELARVREASGGNPFYAIELSRELVRDDRRPAPGQALRVPETLRELVGSRLARLPAETLDVLLYVAALARPTVEVVSAAHRDGKDALAALEVAAREGVIDLDNSRLRFTHPLLASICYQQAPAWTRRAVHRALAAAVIDLEERARHLALAADGPDAPAASQLDAAAAQAAARGAPAAAAELCELASALTPEDGALARRRRLRAAEFHRIAGDPVRARDMLLGLLEEASPGTERADVLIALASLVDSPVERAASCDQALAETEDDARCARILAYRTWARLLAIDVPAALADGRRALERAERAGDPGLLATAIARTGQAQLWAGEPAEELLRRGVELEKRAGLVGDWTESPRAMLARLLLRAGRLDEARVILAELEAEASVRGAEWSRVLVLTWVGVLEWLAGNWQRARECVTIVREWCEPHRQRPYNLPLRIMGLLEVDLGLEEQVRALAEETLATHWSTSFAYSTVVSEGTLGRLELALGRVEAAGDHLRDLPQRMLAGGWNEPANAIWGDAIETLIRLGELETARTYLDRFEVNAQRFGSPWPLAVVNGRYRATRSLTAETDTWPVHAATK